jgi:hypothetical protein
LRQTRIQACLNEILIEIDADHHQLLRWRRFIIRPVSAWLQHTGATRKGKDCRLIGA